MTANAGDGRPSAPPKLRGGELAAAAVRQLRGHWRALAPLWLAAAVLVTAVYLTAHQLGVATNRPSLTVDYWVFQVCAAALSAIVGALVLRVLLAAPDRRYRVDGALLAYVGLIAAIYLVGYVENFMITPMIVIGGALPVAVISIMLLVAFVFIGAKLALWPAAILLDRRDVGPAQSWRLMTGAAGGLVLANILGGLCFLVPGVVLEMVLGVNRGAPSPVAMAGNAVLGMSFTFYIQAVVAVLYRVRVSSEAV